MAIQKKEKFLTSQYIFVTLMYLGNTFVNYYYVGMITSVANAMGASVVLSGLTSSVYSITPIFLRNILGVVVDKFGKWKTNVVGILINLVCCIVMMFCTSVWALIITRAVMGVGFALTTIANYASAADVVPETRRAEGLGWFQNMSSLSEYIGPTLALFAVSATPGSYVGLHVGGVLACVWALAFNFGVKYEKSPEYLAKLAKAKEIDKNENADTGDMFIPPKSKVFAGLEMNGWVLVLCIFLISAAHGCGNTYFILAMQNRGLESYASNFFLCMAIGLFAGRAIVSKLTDKYGAVHTMVPVYLIAAAALIGIGTVTSGPAVVALGFPFGLMFGTMASGSQALLVNSVMPVRRAYANSMYLLAMDLAFGVMPIFWGAVITAVGYSNVYIVAAACPILAAIIMTIYWKKVGHTIFDEIKAYGKRMMEKNNAEPETAETVEE